jgi:hypothetical protein
LFVAWLVLDTVAGAQGGQVEDSPTLERLTERTIAREEGAAATPAEKIPPHEAILAPSGDRKPEFADKVPPPKIAERPGEEAPSPDARWIEGYWDWDKTRRDFAWVTGTWRVPPSGKFWVEGYWRREENGWYRVPGFWSERRTVPTAGRGSLAPRDRIRVEPLPERPVETVGAAPAPDFFYVPGEYVPQGEEVVWKPGFWYRSQPGWEWYPAHWVRQANGWVFREGSWNRVAGTPSPPPGSGPVSRGATIVSTPAGPGTTPNDMTANSLVPISAVAPSGDGSNAAGAAPTTASGGTGNGDANPGPRSMEGEMPAATARPAQVAGTTPAGGVSPAPAPGGYGSQPMYNYPAGRTQGNYPPWGGGTQWNGWSGYGGFMNRFLPY